MQILESSLSTERSRESNRIQAILEGANIKLGSVVTDISGKTSMEISSAIADGNTDPEGLSKLAKGSLVGKKALLEKALKGSLGTHQLIMIREQVEQFRAFTGCGIRYDALKASRSTIRMDIHG